MAGKMIGVAVSDSDLLELTISKITVLIEGQKNERSGAEKVFLSI